MGRHPQEWRECACTGVSNCEAGRGKPASRASPTARRLSELQLLICILGGRVPRAHKPRRCGSVSWWQQEDSACASGGAYGLRERELELRCELLALPFPSVFPLPGHLFLGCQSVLSGVCSDFLSERLCPPGCLHCLSHQSPTAHPRPF